MENKESIDLREKEKSIRDKYQDRFRIQHAENEGKKNIHFLLRAAGKAQAEQRLFWRWKLRRPHLTQRVWVLFLLLPKLPVPFPCHRYEHTPI